MATMQEYFSMYISAFEDHPMEFKQLEAFVAAAESRSFSLAARRRYLTQPTISSHIRALEEELDCILFVRSKRSVILTESGERLFPFAKRLLDLRNEAVKEVKTPKKHMVCLGASTIPSGYLLPRLLSMFREKEPEVYFTIHQSDSDQVETMVLDGMVEIGLIGKKSEKDNLECIPFCRDTLVLAMPATEHYLKMSAAPACELLLSEPVILREEGSGTLKAMNTWLAENHLDPSSFNIVARNNDLEFIKRMIVDGLGISIMSGLSVKDLADSGRLILLPLPASTNRQFYVLRRKGGVLPEGTDVFYRFLLEKGKEIVRSGM